MITNSYEDNQSRIHIIKKTIWIFKTFATNTSWCIYETQKNIRDVIKPIALDLLSDDLLETWLHKKFQKYYEAKINVVVWKRYLINDIVGLTAFYIALVYAVTFVLLIALVVFMKVFKKH